MPSTESLESEQQLLQFHVILGKSPKSIQELTPEQLLPYVRRLIDTELTDVEMQHILKKMGMETDVWPITKIIIENDVKLKKLLLRFK